MAWGVLLARVLGSNSEGEEGGETPEERGVRRELTNWVMRSAAWGRLWVSQKAPTGSSGSGSAMLGLPVATNVGRSCMENAKQAGSEWLKICLFGLR